MNIEDIKRLKNLTGVGLTDAKKALTEADGDFDKALEAKYNKLEVQRFQEEIDEMNVLYGGIKDLSGNPAIVFVVDMLHDRNAVAEANKLNIPVVALADTNCDPRTVTYPVPCNDDALKAIELVCDYVKQAIEAGKAKQKAAKPADKGDKAPEVAAKKQA